MAWFIPMAISAVSSISQGNQASAQNTTSMAWNQYNAQTSYNTTMTNIASSMALTSINAKNIAAASSNKSRLIVQSAEMNANIINATTLYNDSLLENEEAQMWDQMELDLGLLGMQRAVERSGMEAVQAASGTVMGDGSNADVIIDQQTQASLDALVVRHNADIKSSDIANARAKGAWEGEMAVKKIIWEGNMASISETANANNQINAMITESNIRGLAGSISAQSALTAGQTGASQSYSQNQGQINNGVTSGLFGAASQGTANYFQQKQTSAGSSLISGK